MVKWSHIATNLKVSSSPIVMLCREKKTTEFQIVGQKYSFRKQVILQPWLLWCNHGSPGADWNCHENKCHTPDLNYPCFFPIKPSMLQNVWNKKCMRCLYTPRHNLDVQWFADAIFKGKEKKNTLHSLCRYIVVASSSSCAQVSSTSAGFTSWLTVSITIMGVIGSFKSVLKSPMSYLLFLYNPAPTEL